jgi:hypothetical protein
MAEMVTCRSFTNYLVRQEPVYDKRIMADVRPNSGTWIGHVSVGQFPAFSGVEHTQDRLHSVYPDTTQAWDAVTIGDCVGTPCDPTENEIGWGASRLTYGLERQSWSTKLLCFDELRHVTHAKEHFNQIISKILRPATSTIMTGLIRKRALDHAGTKWVADASMSEFTFNWVKVGTSETYLDVSHKPTSRLTPQMLQRRVEPLMLDGYMGESPFKDEMPLIELVSDMNTVWDLDKAVSDSNISDKWRYQVWDAANKYYRYGFSGQLGNYATRVDPTGMRFNYVGVVGGKHRFQFVQPYKNVASSGAGGAAGIKSIVNPDYQEARYGISFIWHKMAMDALVSDTTPVNPEMPFSSRNLGGKWKFVMDNLTCGIDVNGNPIAVDNTRRNKGKFIADFELAIRPLQPQFAEAIFHKRAPACLVVQDTCGTDPGYPAQSYDSQNEPCPEEG